MTWFLMLAPIAGLAVIVLLIAVFQISVLERLPFELPFDLADSTVNYILAGIVIVLLNLLFIAIDRGIVRRSGRKPGGWMWIGLVLTPVTLIGRAYGAVKKIVMPLIWIALIAAIYFSPTLLQDFGLARLSEEQLSEKVQAFFTDKWDDDGYDVEIYRDLSLTHDSGNSYSGSITVTYKGERVKLSISVEYEDREIVAELKDEFPPTSIQKPAQTPAPSPRVTERVEVLP
jgi:hypothetical protein